MTVIAILALVATVCININMEIGLIVLNTFLISNNMALTLFGGICTGLVVVLAEKNYKYHLDKNTTKDYLHNVAMMLYSDFYYMHRDINELLCDRSMKLPKNLFTNRLQIMQNRLWGIANTEYCVFRKSDKFMLAHNDFQRDKFMLLKNRMDQYIYFEIAFTEAEINQLKNADENIYKVLKVLDGFAKEAMEILNQYLSVLQNDSPKKYNWSQKRDIIYNSYLGLYNSGNVDGFLKRNLNEHS